MTLDPAAATTQELFDALVALLAEARQRGAVRDGNSLLGQYAEWLVAEAYGGELAPVNTPDVDLVAEDGRRIQVKSRETGGARRDNARKVAFHSLRFDAAVVLGIDGPTFEVVWARELNPDDVRALAPTPDSTGDHRITAAQAHKLGVDVTHRFNRS